MADIRIKDLTTTASSTASDDFIAVDGTTNGTRKLNAFSPTFGGNATVTGTLTVNGASAAISGGTPSGNQRLALSNAYDATQIGAFYGAPATSLKFFNVGWDVATYGSNFGGYTIGGNRGIAGATSDSHLRLFCPASHEIRFSTISSNDGWTTTNPSFTTLATISSTALTVNATTASTTTSSGALVVSGGVGVAKSLNVGEAVTVAGGSFAAASFYKSASLGMVLSGATGSSYDLYLTNPAGNYVMQVPTGTRNAEFAATLTTVGAITSGASISTSAPVGGAGAWELGTYSSTAPSATGYVTIEIGGTVYKLLASNV